MAAVALLVALATSLVLVVASIPPVVPVVLSVVVVPLSLVPVAILTINGSEARRDNAALANPAFVPAPAQTDASERSSQTRFRPDPASIYRG